MKCHGIESNSKVEQDVREFRHGLMYVTARCASLYALAWSSGASSITCKKLSPPGHRTLRSPFNAGTAGQRSMPGGWWWSCGRPIVVKIRVFHSSLVWVRLGLEGGRKGLWGYWATVSYFGIVNFCFWIFSSLFGSNANKDCVLKGCGIENKLILLKFNRD